MAIDDLDELRKIYEDAKTIAVVGASDNPRKAAHTIPRYLQRVGYRILPVNPKGGEILGEKVYTSLQEITEPIDVVDVFRPSEETPGHRPQRGRGRGQGAVAPAGDPVRRRRAIASEGGLKIVMDRCMGETDHQLKLGPGPSPDPGTEARPNSRYVSISPFPLTSTERRRRNTHR